jgi:hypothetical protein
VAKVNLRSVDGTPLKDRVTRRSKLINHQLFLQRNRDLDRAVLVLGSGRGGTTWLAEQMARQVRGRMMFEPFHPDWSPIAADVPLFTVPDRQDAAARRAAERVLSGRFRLKQVDQVLCDRLPASRVVKDIHTTNLVSWYRAQFPAVPIVFVLRHPIATSLSRLRARNFYGVGAYLETRVGRENAEISPVATWLPLYDELSRSDEPLIRHVAEWCIENAYPLTCMNDSGVTLAYYEHLVLDGIAEFARLSTFCRSTLRTARPRRLDSDDLEKPSAMDWNGTAASTTGIRDWEAKLARWTGEVDPGLAVECMKVVAEFGIELAYDERPVPVSHELYAH